MMLIIANSIGVENGLTGIPNKIKILPVGMVESQKGDFFVDKESFLLMKEDMQNHGVDVVIDYEHQTLKDCQAPASGWVKDLTYTPDAIVAKVEWTPKAKQYLKDKEYRYLSPVIMTRKGDKKAVKLHSLALTNTPAINNMFPIINRAPLPDEEDDNNLIDGSEDRKDKKNVKRGILDMRKIIELLKISEDATEEQVMNELIKRLTAGEVQGHKLEIETILDKGLRSGKILPYQMEDMRILAESNLEGFKAFINKAPQIVPIGKLDLVDAPNKGGKNTRDICETLGLSMADYEKYSNMEL